MASAGTVVVDFAAETAKFTAELKKVNARLSALESDFTSLEKAANKALEFLSVAAFGAFIKSASDAADALGKTADKLQISTESLKAFQLAAKDAGVDLATANTILIEGQKRLGEASDSTSAAAKTLHDLGLNVEDLKKLNAVELFRTYSTSIAELKTTSDRAAASQVLMGRSAAEALGFIVSGNGKLDEASGFVKEFGLALDRIDTKKIQNANDDIDRLGTVSQAAGQKIAVGLAPFVSALSTALIGATGNLQAVQTRAGQFGAILQVAFGIAANAARVLEAALFIVGEVISAVLAAISGALGELFDIIAKGADAVAAFQLSIVNLIPGELGDKLRAKVEELQQPLLNVVHNVAASTNALTDTLKSWVDSNREAADEALSHVQSIQQIQDGIIQTLEEGQKRAQEAAKPPPEGTKALPGFDIVEFTKQSLQDLLHVVDAGGQERIALERKISDAIDAETSKRIDDQLRRESDFQKELKQIRSNTLDAGIAALQAFAGKSKAIQKLVIVAEKARALASIIIDTRTAAAKALSIYGPTPAGYGAAATAIAFGAIQAAAVVAAGVGELQSVNSGGSGGAPIGTPANPLVTQPSSSQGQPGATSQRAVQVIFNGPVFDATQTARFIVDTLKSEINDRDVVVITNTNSAQYNILKNG